MHLVELGDGSLLVHSPTWIDEATVEKVTSLGTPRLLFAPNHYHHRSLGRYVARFSSATSVASRQAIPRLVAQTSLAIQPLDEVPLPAGMRWLVPDGTKNGEAWLAVDEDDGTTWIVCDAFFNEERPLVGVEGAFLRLLKIAPGLCVGATFTLLCLSDKPRYRAWVQDALERERPRRILFSHGSPLDADATPKLAERLRGRLG